MGGRSFYNAAGELVEIKFPVFDTEAEAPRLRSLKGF
jgi:hypothetical protein